MQGIKQFSKKIVDYSTKLRYLKVIVVYYVGLYMEFLVYVFQSETFLYYLSYYKKDSCKSGLYTGFLPRGANLEYVKKRGEYVKKRGGEAVCSCRAAAGGWVQERDVPPLAQNVFLSEIHCSVLRS